MARVPVAQSTRSVTPVNVPSPAGSVPGATSEAFGGSVARALQETGREISRQGEALSIFAIKQQIEDNEREAKELDARFAEEVRRVKYGDGTEENPGFFGLNGQNAVEQRQRTIEAMNTIRTNMLAQASNSSVKTMFGNTSQARLGQSLDGIERHVAAQRVEAAKDASEARSNEFVQDAAAAYTDNEAIAFALRGLETETRSFWENQGADPDVVEHKVEEARTVLHRGVIDRYLANGELVDAKTYYEGVKDQIDGDIRTEIEADFGRKASQSLSLIRHEANQIIDALDAGKVPEGVEAVQQTLASIAPANESAAVLLDKLNNSVGDQEAVRDFAALPFDTQAQALSEYRRQEDVSVDAVRRAEKMAKVHADFAKAMEEGEGIQFAADYGVIDPLTPVDFTDPVSLNTRRVMAETASRHYGTFIAPLTDAEVDQFVDSVKGDAPDGTPPTVGQAVSMLGAAYQGLGVDYAEQLIDDLREKGEESLVAALSLAPERPRVAEQIVRGERFLRENREFAPSNAERLEASSAVLGNMFTPATLEARGPIMAAADAVYATMIAAKGEADYDPALHEEAIAVVTGGILNHNGRNVLPPVAGMEQGQFSDLVERITDEDLADPETGQPPVFANGDQFSASMLEDSFFRRGGQLVSTSDKGHYQIFYPGSGFVMKPDMSDPVEINLRDILLDGRLTATPEVAPPEPPPLSELSETEAGVPEPQVVERETDVPQDTLFDFVGTAEGIRSKVYLDTEGNPTVGIGFNLNRKDARAKIEAVGANYEAVLEGTEVLDRTQIQQLFEADMASAVKDAKSLVPGFEELSPARQAVLIDMAFNLGRTRLSRFTNMLAAINRGDWETAANEARNSKWFRQVKNRGVRNVEILRQGRFSTG